MSGLPEPFRPEGEHIACDLPGARVLFTTRRGGVSAAPYDSLNLGGTTDSAAGGPQDDIAAVQANRELVAAQVGIPRERTAQGRQVHGAEVRRVRRALEAADAPADADGQATALEGIATAVLVADCLPVAVAGEGGVAMLHAGWRGLAGGVLEEGVAALRELGVSGGLHAAIGPGAGVCCYETGDEVHAAFAADGPGARDGRNADLKHVARLRLRAAGVGTVHDVGLCTMCAPAGLLFSHRRDGGVTGRQAGIAWRS